MRKLPAFILGLGLALAACAPFGASNRLAQSLTPTPPAAVVEYSPEPLDENAASEEAVAALSEEDIVAPAPSGKNLQPLLDEADINLSEVIALLPPDAIRAIAPAEVPQILVTAAEAQAGGIDPKVRVIGIEVDGESHAYPIPYLSAHEIVNVDINGQHLAVTW